MKPSRFIVFILVLKYSLALSQRPSSIPQNVPTSPYNTSQQSTDTEEDSLVYQYFTLKNIYSATPFKDTALHEEVIPFYHFDRSRKTIVNSGNLGSAAHNLLFDPVIYTGWHSGYEQYRFYNYDENNYRIFTGNKPVADLLFSQLANQDNIMPGATFYRPFSEGLSVNINYRRISQAGIYAQQRTRTTNLGMTVAYQEDNKPYSFFLTYLRNINEEGNNGGIHPDTNLIAENLKSVIPTLLNNASTRHQHERIILDQFYIIKGKAEKSLSIQLRNQTSFNPAYYKYSDVNANTANDTFVYGDLITDSRGLRRYVDLSHFRNMTEISLRTKKNQEIRAGLTYDYFNVTNEPTREIRHDVTLHFKSQVPIAQKFLIDVDGRLGVGENIGNFDVKGQLDLNWGKYVHLNGYGRFFNAEQSYASRILVLNFDNFMDQSRRKSLGSDIGASLSVPALKLSVSLKQQLWNNPVFWDNAVKPKQLDGVLSVTQLSLHHQLMLSSFVLENDGWFQIFSENIYNLPQWISYHRLYWSGILFRKVMEVHLGANARLMPAYNGMGYSPVWGQFYAADERLGYFPAVDFFLQAKVSKFRAVFVYENAGLLFRNIPNFDIARYPQFQPTLRFGFRWLLLN